MDRWTELAAQWGIESGYYDVHGQHHETDDETLRRVVEGLCEPGSPPASTHPQPRQPQPAYQGDGRCVWVLAVQLYAVRSRRNWGHGDFTDLARLLELVASLGGAGIGLNPLHAQFYDRADCSGSPYAPNSRLFINPLYIDVEAIEEFQPVHIEAVTDDIARLRGGDLVDYPKVATLKLVALRNAYFAFAAHGSIERRVDFDAYRKERGRELESFAAFETLRGQHVGAWWDWPEPWRKPDKEALRCLRHDQPDEIAFHEFLQWNAERQLARCHDIACRHGLSIGLYLDTAIGVDAGGADAWIEQGNVLRGLSIGAPPDHFNPAGQDWGLTAYNPHGLVANNFEPFRQMLRAAMRYAGAVRVDHVLGLMRLFVIPRGFPPSHGAYLRFPFDDMLAVVAEESRRWTCIAVGEDLGTVPENLRPMLAAWGVWSYLVTLFERNWDGSFRRPADYPHRAVATFNTHDLPTFAGWMTGHDLRTKRAIGVDPGETDEERHRSRRALDAAVKAHNGTQNVGFEDVVAFLAATPTRLVSLAVEDVLDIADQINVPGTVAQYPNWRRRWPLALEEIASDQRLPRIAATLARAGRGSAPES